MSTALAKTGQSKVEVFVGRVLPPDRMGAVLATLPDHVKPERFERNLLIAVSQHPKLLECDPVAVFNEVCKAAALGLYLDPQLGEAYLITGWDSRANRPAPQLRTGYRGLMKLSRQSGQVKQVYAHEVCENDTLEISLGTDKKLIHKPDFQAERGAVALYYAVVHFQDGSYDFEVMSLKEIHRIRDRSDGWKAFKAGKIKSTPWGTDEGEMAKKTVLRRLLKRLPQSPELADASRLDDDDYLEGEAESARPALAERLRIAKGGNTSGFSRDHVHREIHGETDDAEATAANQTVEHGETDSGAANDTSEIREQAGESKSSAAPAGAPAQENSHIASDPSPSDGDQEAAPADGPQRSGAASASYDFGAYNRALARATQKKSLDAFSNDFRAKNAWTTEEDALDVLRAIYKLNAQKLKGELTAQQFVEGLKELGVPV